MYHEFDEEIPLPLAEIYAFMRTPKDWTRLYGSFGEVVDRGDGWYAVPLRRFPFPLVAQIIEDVPDRRVAWEFRGFWRGTGGVDLAATTSGTMVTGYEDISIPRLAGLGPVIERRYLERRFQAVWDSGWRRLRRMAAAEAGRSALSSDVGDVQSESEALMARTQDEGSLDEMSQGVTQASRCSFRRKPADEPASVGSRERS